MRLYIKAKHHGGGAKAMRVVRTETDDGKRIVGLHLGQDVIDLLQETLGTLDVAGRCNLTLRNPHSKRLDLSACN